jgi:List-Bact-rpt repeat protein
MRGFSVVVVVLVIVSLLGNAYSSPRNSRDRGAVSAASSGVPLPESPVPQADWTVFDVWWDFGSNDIFFDWSADSGDTWHADKRINDQAGSASGSGWQLPLPAVAVDSANWAIYVAWADVRNGNLDIYFSSSSDGGASWSANTRINDDTGSAVQYMVDLAVDGTGTVHAAWEDKRNGSWNIFYSNSTDGGRTWSANLRISSENTPGTYNRPGDYFAIEAGPGDGVSIVWTDGRGADFDIYYAQSPLFSNVRIIDDSSPYAWQVEPTMAVNLSGIVFVGWKETDGPEAAGLRVAASYSTDSGATWAPNVLMNQSHPGGGCSNSDPWMALTPDDRVQYAYLEYNCNNGSNGLNVANTSDGNWGAVHYAPGDGGLTDKDSIVVAPSGRIYAAWDEGNVMDVTWSDDEGATWSPFEDPDDAPGGVLGAIIQIGGPVATITFTTTPIPLPITVDGVTTTSPAVYGWVIGSSHSIGVSSPLPGGTGTRFVWTSWSDGGAMAHTILADADRTITADFQKQDEVKIGTSPKGLKVLVDGLAYNEAASFWWDEGSAHEIEAVSPQPLTDVLRYVWTSWSDSGAQSHSIAVSGPLSLTAVFSDEQAMRISTTPEGRTFTVDSVSYTVPTTFWFAPNTYHVLSAPTPQSSTGTRYEFLEWSDGGSATHIVTFQAAMTIEARFSAEYFLEVNSPVSGATGGGWYPAGATVVAEVAFAEYAVAAGERLLFLRWGGDASGTGLTSNPIVMDGPKQVLAVYGTEYRLTVSSDYGDVSGDGWYRAGESAFATVSSMEVPLGTGVREAFVGWTNDATGSEATSAPIVMNQAKSATASWQRQYFLQIDSDVGTVEGSGWYAAGQTVELRAPALMTASGTTYRFAGWTGSISDSEPTVTVTVSGPMTVRATWQSAGAVDILGTPSIGLGVLVVILALAAGILVWRWNRRRD